MHNPSGIQGATLVELVTVVVLIGIIAAIAAPRFFKRPDFDERGFFEVSLSAVRYAQKLAITSGCDTRVLFQAGGFSIRQWGACIPTDHTTASNPVSRPGGGSFTDNAPNGVAVSNLDFFFDSIGRPRQVVMVAPPNRPPLITNPASLQVTIGPRTAQVEPQTGYTRCITGC